MKLRISHVVVQPVLVWDDGEELTSGPGLEPVSLPLSALSSLSESLPAEIIALQTRLLEEAKSESN